MDKELKELRDQLAFVSGLLWKVLIGVEVTDNELQSLSNIKDDLGFYDLPDSRFRW